MFHSGMVLGKNEYVKQSINLAGTAWRSFILLLDLVIVYDW